MGLQIIDARTGKYPKVGQWLELVFDEEWYDPKTDTYTSTGKSDESYKLVSVEAGIFSADVEVEFRDGRRHKSALPIRYMHPSFMFQRVLFIPT